MLLQRYSQSIIMFFRVFGRFALLRHSLICERMHQQGIGWAGKWLYAACFFTRESALAYIFFVQCLMKIIIPIHNRIATTKRLMDCLQKQKFKGFQIILVDDGCTDGTAEMVCGYFPDTKVLRGNGSWWWGGSLHQAYKVLLRDKSSGDETILILNDDIIFDANFLAKGEKLLSAMPDTLLLPYDYDEATGELIDCGVHVDWRNLSIGLARSPAEVNILSTRGLFLRKSTFLSIGGFHPHLIPHYLSDYDFTHRAYRKGFRLIADQTLRIRENTKLTGLRDARVSGIRAFFRVYFSKRSGNFYPGWFFFILFNSPLRYLPLNFYRISFTRKWLRPLLVVYRDFIQASSDLRSKKVFDAEFKIVKKTEIGEILEADSPRKVFGHPKNLFLTAGWAVDPLNSQTPAKGVVVFENDQPVRVLKNNNYLRKWIRAAAGISPPPVMHFRYFQRESGTREKRLSFYALSSDGKTIARMPQKARDKK